MIYILIDDQVKEYLKRNNKEVLTLRLREGQG